MPSYFAYFGVGSGALPTSTAGGIYWAPTYWPRTYFTAPYWSRLPAGDLLEAIWYWYVGTTITASFPGGLWIGRAAAGTSYPLATMESLGTDFDFDTSSTTIRRDSVRFSAWASDKETARQAAATLLRGLWQDEPYSRLVYDGGREIQRFPRSDNIVIARDTSLDGADLWQAFFSFDFMCQEPGS